MEFKGVVNNGEVVKNQAKQVYNDTFESNVNNGKMTELRKEELLEKIEKVASSDAQVFSGTETDIRMTRDGENGAIIIDSIVNFIKTVEGQEDYMNVSYAAAKCTI